jgi:hypothetical protein
VFNSWSRAITTGILLVISGFVLSACSLPGQKTFSGVQVEVTESMVAQVYLDGLHYGHTPFEKKDIRPGTYTLRVEPGEKDKKPYETQIHLYPNTITSVMWSFKGAEPTGSGEIYELEPLASQDRSELSVITVPEGAKISLDTKSYGLSPVVVESAPVGSAALSIEAVAHVKKSTPIELMPGFRLNVFARLNKEADALAQPGDGSDQALSPDTSNANSPDSVDSQGQVQADTLPSSDSLPTDTNPNASPLPAAADPLPSSARTTILSEPTKPYALIKETGTGWLRVRSQASSAGEEVARVDVGGKYKYFSSLNGWLEIEYESGKTGWISGQYADVIR